MNSNEILNNVINNMDAELAASIRGFIKTDERVEFDDINWSYFQAKNQRKKRWLCCWSINKNIRGKYVSWIYKETTQEGQFKFTKLVEHTKRKDAKARALKLNQQRRLICLKNK